MQLTSCNKRAQSVSEFNTKRVLQIFWQLYSYGKCKTIKRKKKKKLHRIGNKQPSSRGNRTVKEEREAREPRVSRRRAIFPRVSARFHRVAQQREINKRGGNFPRIGRRRTTFVHRKDYKRIPPDDNRLSSVSQPTRNPFLDSCFLCLSHCMHAPSTRPSIPRRWPGIDCTSHRTAIDDRSYSRCLWFTRSSILECHERDEENHRAIGAIVRNFDNVSPRLSRDRLAGSAVSTLERFDSCYLNCLEIATVWFWRYQRTTN